MSLLASFYGHCLVPVALIYIVIRWSIATELLAGVRCWTVPSAKNELEEQAAAKPDSSARPRTSKHESRAGRAAKQEVRFPGSTSLRLAPLDTKTLPAAQHFKALEIVVVAWVVLVGATTVELLRAATANVAVSAVPGWLAVFAACAGLWALIEVDVLSGTVPRSDRWYILGVSLLGAGVAAATLTLVRAHVLDFDVDEAAEELEGLLQEFTSTAFPELAGLKVAISPRVVTGVLATLAGLISGLLASASLRAARCYELAVRTPQFAQQFITTPWLISVVLTVSMALPPLATLLWVTPLCQDLGPFSDEQMQSWRSMAMMVLGVLQLVAARGCAQSYLHAAMIQWWTHKHSAMADDAGKAQRMGIYIKLRADFINTMFCKVAAQVAAPALLWLAAGVVLSLNQMAEKQTGVKNPSRLWTASALLNGSCGFLSWWTCCSWSLFSMIALALYRFGYLVH